MDVHFEDLEVYQVCREFRKEIAAIVKEHFPEDEKYLLYSQIMDSSRLITKSLAEGHGRNLYSQYLDLLGMTRSALMETLEHLVIAHDEGYITPDILINMRKRYHRCLKVLNAYAMDIKRKIG